MMNRGTPSHAITGAFVFLLLGIFAVFSTVMVLMGAKAYRGTVERSDANNTARIASSYIRSMLRSDDEEDVLTIEEIDGIGMITMVNNYGGDSYITRLYVYNGSLREYFADAEMEFDPEWGEKVCEAESMQAEFKDGLLSVKITANGVESEVLYAPKAGITEGGN